MHLLKIKRSYNTHKLDYLLHFLIGDGQGKNITKSFSIGVFYDALTLSGYMKLVQHGQQQI